MRDIDFLVEDEAVREVEATLSELGYRQSSSRPPAFYERHHHSTPFVHPDTGTWVEVHRGLFAPGSALGAEGVFEVRNLAADLRPSRFRGRRVRRLSEELQVVYLACHWANGLHAVGGMVAMADMIYLIRNTPSLDWERILRSTCGSVSSRHLSLLLTYLDKHRLIDLDPAILHALRARRAAPGGITLRLAHALLDHYVVDGR